MNVDPLDFWNYPDWLGGSKDNPADPRFQPFWDRPTFRALPPPPRKPARTIAANEPLGWDCGSIQVEMPARLNHVKVPDPTWAFLVVRAQGVLFRGAKLTIPTGKKAGTYEWTGDLWQEYIEGEVN
jgi:hypothetical protein